MIKIIQEYSYYVKILFENKRYAPNVSENVLSKLVAAFSSLRKLSDQGLISYPFSTREIVNIPKHLEKFPNDSLASVIANVSDFDHFSDQNDLKNTFREVIDQNSYIYIVFRYFSQSNRKF